MKAFCTKGVYNTNDHSNRKSLLDNSSQLPYSASGFTKVSCAGLTAVETLQRYFVPFRTCHQEAFVCQKLHLGGREGVVEWWIRLGLCPQSLYNLIKKAWYPHSPLFSFRGTPFLPLVTFGNVWRHVGLSELEVGLLLASNGKRQGSCWISQNAQNSPPQ